jgi:hypothetical protein
LCYCQLNCRVFGDFRYCGLLVLVHYVGGEFNCRSNIESPTSFSFDKGNPNQL